MSEINALLHVSLLIGDVARSREFYEGLLGLTPSSTRPELGFPGVWYDLGAAQIHLIQSPNPDPVEGRPEHGGRDRHTAFGVRNWDTLRARLDDLGVRYTLSRSGRRALFCRDPDGNALELVESM
jgi:glyoxylase I family protein